MKILLAGGVLEATALLQALAHSSNHEIILCADGARAIVDLLKNGYDWAIIDGSAVNRGDKDIARFIRAMSPEACRNSVTPVQANTFDAGSANQAKCGVEWSKGGVLQLHCRLHAILKNSTTPWRSDLGCAGEILFEYHAPCKKERWRNG